jgi:DNA-directed RNA polymerase, sigma subunit (sigma70/sigma32)
MPLAFLEGTPEYPGRQGIVDVYVARPGQPRDLVIEIDRGNKRWSARKLGYAVSNGKAAIWVRWSGLGPPSAIVPGGVEVIYLDVRRQPLIQPAQAKKDQVEPADSSLSGASRALLAALFPSGAPNGDPTWGQEHAVWAAVGQLPPRLTLVVRCRFGYYGPRPLTLARTAEVLANELGELEVSGERIRQLQTKALRTLRSRSSTRVRAARRAAGLQPQPTTPRARRAENVPIDVLDEEQLRGQVRDIVLAAGRADIKATMVCHVLRGSSGEATRRIVARHGLPHDGALRGYPYLALHETVVGIAQRAPFRLVEGYVRLSQR